MLIYQSFDWEDTRMDVNIDLPQLVSRIVETAYPELKQSRIKAQWGRSSSFATISWTQDLKDIRIRCSLETIEWHEAALTGLLAHELSHPAQGRKTQSERSTDLDAIERGFGPYLGTERLLAGKYDDHLIRRGKDRYLGYKTIRKQLDDNELKHLDALLKQIRLVPSRKVSKKEVHHDIVIIHSSRNTTIRVDGHEFILPLQNEDMEVRIVVKDSTTYVMVDNDEVGYFSNPTT